MEVSRMSEAIDSLLPSRKDAMVSTPCTNVATPRCIVEKQSYKPKVRRECCGYFASVHSPRD